MPDPSPPGTGDPAEIGGYRLAGILGEGGQGVVHLGLSASGAKVAIKLLHTRMADDPGLRRRFLREAELTRAVAAFCTAQVVATGVVGNRPYLISEYVPGPSLRELVAADGPRTGGGLDRLAITTLTALAAVHRAGVVHRDFKPSNVVMGPEGPVVVDFGIARLLEHTTTRSELMGSPSYISPEQFDGQEAGTASDVFAWAATVVYAATGRPAFSGATPAAVMGAVLNREPDLTGVPDRLRPLLAACLAKDPAARPTVTAALHALTGEAPADPALTGEAPAGLDLTGEAPAGLDLTDGTLRVPRPADPRPDARPADAPAEGSRPDDARPGGSRPDDARPGGSRAGSPRGPLAAAAGQGGAPRGAGPARRRLLVAGTAAAALLLVPAILWLRQPEVPRDPGPLSPSASSRDSSPDGSPGRTAAGTPPVHGEPVWTVATARLNGRTVVVSGDGRTVRLWDPATGEPVGRPLTGHTDGVSSVTTARLRGRTVVVSGSDDRTVRVWDPATGEPVGVPLTGHTGWVESVAAAESADGAIVVSGGYNGMVRSWDLATGEPAGPPVVHPGGVEAVAVARIGGRTVVVAGSRDHTVRLWDPATGKAVGAPLTGHTHEVHTVAVAELDGRTVVVSGSHDHTVRIWDPATGEPIGRPLTGHTREVMTVTTAELDGRTVVVSGGNDGTVRLWDPATGEPIGRPLTGHTGGVLSATATATELDGKAVLVTGGQDRTVRIWDLTTGAEHR
ncbi:WD40 repeat domain-containing serine/threonine protein kinase [Planobispora takensis]|uniref:Protein kinase n=1 Tax=Planobispora takensis TaxID=1367882 RepID=A0A8J3SZK4_9ACTN|nr:serine/threonine-protein kinase [Planobispora takensis]GII03362.1 protein kinase [Planobispora takensis]